MLANQFKSKRRKGKEKSNPLDNTAAVTSLPENPQSDAENFADPISKVDPSSNAFAFCFFPSESHSSVNKSDFLRVEEDIYQNGPLHTSKKIKKKKKKRKGKKLEAQISSNTKNSNLNTKNSGPSDEFLQVPNYELEKQIDDAPSLIKEESTTSSKFLIIHDKGSSPKTCKNNHEIERKLALSAETRENIENVEATSMINGCSEISEQQMTSISLTTLQSSSTHAKKIDDVKSSASQESLESAAVNKHIQNRASVKPKLVDIPKAHPESFTSDVEINKATENLKTKNIDTPSHQLSEESCFSREENNCGEKEAINSNLCRKQKPDSSMHSLNERYSDSYNEKSKSTNAIIKKNERSSFSFNFSLDANQVSQEIDKFSEKEKTASKTRKKKKYRGKKKSSSGLGSDSDLNQTEDHEMNSSNQNVKEGNGTIDNVESGHFLSSSDHEKNTINGENSSHNESDLHLPQSSDLEISEPKIFEQNQVINDAPEQLDHPINHMGTIYTNRKEYNNSILTMPTRSKDSTECKTTLQLTLTEDLQSGSQLKINLSNLRKKLVKKVEEQKSKKNSGQNRVKKLLESSNKNKRIQSSSLNQKITLNTSVQTKAVVNRKSLVLHRLNKLKREQACATAKNNFDVDEKQDRDLSVVKKQNMKNDSAFVFDFKLGKLAQPCTANNNNTENDSDQMPNQSPCQSTLIANSENIIQSGKIESTPIVSSRISFDDSFKAKAVVNKKGLILHRLNKLKRERPKWGTSKPISDTRNRYSSSDPKRVFMFEFFGDCIKESEKNVFRNENDSKDRISNHNHAIHVAYPQSEHRPIGKKSDTPSLNNVATDSKSLQQSNESSKVLKDLVIDNDKTVLQIKEQNKSQMTSPGQTQRVCENENEMKAKIKEYQAKNLAKLRKKLTKHGEKQKSKRKASQNRIHKLIGSSESKSNSSKCLLDKAPKPSIEQGLSFNRAFKTKAVVNKKGLELHRLNRLKKDKVILPKRNLILDKESSTRHNENNLFAFDFNLKNDKRTNGAARYQKNEYVNNSVPDQMKIKSGEISAADSRFESLRTSRSRQLQQEGVEDPLIFNTTNKGKGMINKSSMMLYRQKKMSRSVKDWSKIPVGSPCNDPNTQMDVDQGDVKEGFDNAFSFGFNLNLGQKTNERENDIDST